MKVVQRKQAFKKKGRYEKSKRERQREWWVENESETDMGGRIGER